jgi:hypothetical protein
VRSQDEIADQGGERDDGREGNAGARKENALQLNLFMTVSKTVIRR